MSLEPKALAAYIRNIRAIETQLGDGALDMQEIELDVRDKAGRSVVAARPIRAGETLTEAAFIAKRPGGGIGPDELADLVGRVAARDIDAEEPLEWSMVR
jgi:sialic acid synthase SpsE